MRHYGNTNEYNFERDSELLRYYREALCAEWRVTEPHAIRQAVSHPCSRFWVSEERAYAVVCMMLRGRACPTKRPMRRRMFKEIYRRTLAYRKEHPDVTLKMAVTRVVESPAPCFYLTPRSARIILCHHKKKIKACSKQKK